MGMMRRANVTIPGFEGSPRHHPLSVLTEIMLSEYTFFVTGFVITVKLSRY
jgi:hypothetical protein